MSLTRCLRGAFALVVLSALAACGGGGGSSNPNPNPPTFTVGGSVTGLTGSGLTLQNNGGNALAISSNGSFTFTTAIASGSAYSVTVSAQPTNPAQTCTVANGSGTISANITNVTVTCSTNTFTVGGTVTGLAGSGLTLQNNGGDALTISANGAFTFPTAIASGTTYSVTVSTQPTSPAQTCTVANGSGTISANVTNVTVTCSTSTFTVGGTVTGLAGSGLTFQNNGGDALTTSSNGAFTFPTAIASGSAYNVTISAQPTNQTCIVANGTGTIGANVTDVTVACSINTFSVGGSVTGLVGSGLTLQNNAGDTLPISGNGAFTFATAIASGSAYSVTVSAQPTNQTCIVANGSGTIGANVTNVAVTCSTNTFTVGGSVTGLAGAGLTLQNNGGDALPISGNGVFTFTTAIASGSAYSVTVSAHPANPTQTCVVTNGTGTINSIVANVAVTCTTSTFTVGGTLTGLTGTGLVLSNNDTDTLTINADGDFEFTTRVASGGTYDIAIDTVPGSPVQTCTIFNGSGTVTNTDVTNASISCVAANPTFAYGLNRAKGTISTYAVDSTSGQLRPRFYAKTRDRPTGAVTFQAQNGSQFTYVVNQDSSDISGYSAALRTGELVELPGSSFPTSNNLGAEPETLTLHPDRPFLYTVNRASNEITGFAIDEVSGELTWVPNSPLATGTNPQSFTIDPTGRFAYVATPGTLQLYTYAIDQTTGALTEVPGSRLAIGAAIGGIFLDRNGRFLYLINSPGSIAGYSINASTGALTPLAGSPFGTASNAALAGVHPNGKFVYVKHPLPDNSAGNGLSAYVINATSGALTQVAGSQFDNSSNPGPVTFDPAGKYLYAGHFNVVPATFDIRAYAVDADTGALTPVAGGPVTTDQFPSSLDVDPSGKYLYVTNQASDRVSSYAIDANSGVLTAVPGSPANVGDTPNFITVAEDTTPLSFVSKFTYIVDHSFDQLQAFAIDASTGALNAVGTALPVGGSANGVTIDPKNRFAYVPSPVISSVHGYRIDATTGALTEIAGSPFAAGDDPVSVAIDPSGRFAYVAELGVPDLIRRFLIDQTTGALTSPSALAAAGDPLSLTIHPNGQHLYALTQSAGEIFIYDIEQLEGELTPSQSIPVVDAGTQPVAMVIDPSGKYAYVTDANTDTVLAYSISSQTGVPSPIGSYNSNGDTPLGITMDPTGTFLFVANYSSDDVSIFLIQDDGSLLGGVPRDVGDGPTSLAMDYDGRFLRVGNQFDETITTYSFTPVGADLTLVDTDNVPAGIGTGSLAISSHTQ